MTRTAATLLEATDISLTLGRSQLLDNVSFSIESGEIVTLIGPNGAGKTTLIRVILGLLRATTGKIYQRPGISIAYMPQRLQLDATFPLSVKRFLSFAGKKISTGDIRKVLEQTGAAQVMNSAMQQLSGGEFQRVLLARALLRQPHLLVLDEPVQGVDVHGQVELYELIGRIRSEQGCGVFMVSHDLHLVMAATDRVLCLNRHICCSGTPAMVTSDPEYLRMYGHLALYQHDRGHHHEHFEGCSHAR